MLATRATNLSVTDTWDSKTADGSSTGLHGCHQTKGSRVLVLSIILEAAVAVIAALTAHGKRQ
jgi:hypothetical protein